MKLDAAEAEVAPKHREEQRRDAWSTQSSSQRPVADFDGVARAYRWMEYLSLGTLLERARFWAVDAEWLDGCRSALVLGDGDGRFTARLMARNRGVQVEAVDASAAMLRLLQQRCAAAHDRLRVRCADAREAQFAGGADLVVTHFFLDCLEQEEVATLVRRVAAGLAPGGLWVVSEFRVPEGWLGVPAWLLVRGLYLVFRVLTGLKATRLPDYERVLIGAGFEVVAERLMVGGVLVSQVFKARASASAP